MLLKILLALNVLCAIAFGLEVEKHPFRHFYQNSRIVGGSIAPDNYAPYACSLQSGTTLSHFCGASVLGTRAILTAAHCVDSVVHSNGTVFANTYAHCGSNYLYSGGLYFQLYTWINHPNWSAETAKNDIGILYSNSDIVISNYIIPVYPYPGVLGGGYSLVVVGWGLTQANGWESTVLKSLGTYSLSHQQCLVKRQETQDEHGWWVGAIPEVNESAELCVFMSINNGICQGDSGGPLVAPDTNFQVGIASWAVPCAVGGPDVFTRISSYTSWIQAYTV